MRTKDKLILFPPLIGSFIALATLFIFNQVLIKFYFPVDPDPVFGFSPLGYIAFYSAIFPQHY
jgi:hypothetical protein